MAIQQWTILKLVGPAADDASERFNRWWQARRSDDLSFFTPEDWPSRVRRAAADYVSRLVEHRWEMPVVYFNEHIDLWSASGQIQSHLAGVTSRIWHDAGELWCSSTARSRKAFAAKLRNRTGGTIQRITVARPPAH